MQFTYAGPETGVGAQMKWGDAESPEGSGLQETTEVVPGALVRNRLDFGKRGKADSYFEVSPTPEGCKVVWGFDTELGKNPVGRYYGLMFEKTIGSDYEIGLAKLKTLLEPAKP